MLKDDYTTRETQALHLLRQAGFSFCQEIDWLAQSPQGDWLVFEVKHKSRLFHPPPFWGLGLNMSQIYLRRKLRGALSLRCFLMVFFQDEVYGQWLDKLESGRRYTTQKGVRVYPVEVFRKGTEAIMELLNE